MEKFWLALKSELNNRGLKGHYFCGINPKGNFQLQTDLRPNKSISCFVELYPSKTHKHVIEGVETWVGKTRDGEPWSDSMGCMTVNCDGLSYSAAIKKIADGLLECFNEYFA